MSNDLQTMKLRDLVTIRKTGLSSYYLNGKDVTIPLINIKDIQGGIISTESIDRVSIRKTAALEKSRVNEGDIIISMRGLNFKSAVVDKSASGFPISSNLVALTLSEKIKPEVLAAYFESQRGQREILARAGGASIKGLTLETLLNIPIPIPDPNKQELLSNYLMLAKEYEQIMRKEMELREKINNAILEQMMG
ncbi:MAG: restriction endonuclease subunit S [Methanosarcinaceae archaeon]